MTIPDRRTVLRSGLAAAALGAVGAATGCRARPDPSPPAAATPARHHLIGPRSPQVAAAEAARHASGTVQAGVAPETGHVDLGGPVVPTWIISGFAGPAGLITTAAPARQRRAIRHECRVHAVQAT